MPEAGLRGGEIQYYWKEVRIENQERQDKMTSFRYWMQNFIPIYNFKLIFSPVNELSIRTLI